MSGKKEKPFLRVGTATFGERYLLAVPLIGRKWRSLMKEADQAMACGADLLEWRCDHYEGYPDVSTVMEAYHRLRERTSGMPIIVTARHIAEGGKQEVPDASKIVLLQTLAEEGRPELIDIELRYGQEVLQTCKTQWQQSGVKMIVSHHSFDRCLDAAEIERILREAQDSGADIVKLINRADQFEELLTYSKALQQARADFLKVPLIAGAVGKISPWMRVLGDRLGSDLTFVSAGGRKSHAAQLPIDQVRQLREQMQADVAWPLSH